MAPFRTWLTLEVKGERCRLVLNGTAILDSPIEDLVDEPGTQAKDSEPWSQRPMARSLFAIDDSRLVADVDSVR